MFNKRAVIATVALILMGAQAAQADDNLWIGAKVGTLGLGLEGTWQALPYLDLRVGFNSYDYSDDRSEAGIDYTGTLELSTLFATANLRVPLSPFRVTAGIFSNDNKLALVGLDTGSYDIGGVTYPSAQIGTLRSETTFDKTAPYAGIGFDIRIMNKVGLNIDLGVLWQGSPMVAMAADGPLGTDPAFLSELELERIQFEDDIKDFKAYPVISLGLSYKF